MTERSSSSLGGWRGALLGASLFLPCAVRAEGTSCVVRGVEGRVAVYASTNAVREAVVWMPSGTEFAVKGELADENEAVWIRIEPPPNTCVWVYRDLVRSGVVQANKVRVRAGAGLNFHAVGVLNKGDRVDVRGTYGDWIKIKPPDGIDFWVLRDQVEPLASLPPEGVAADTNAVMETEAFAAAESNIVPAWVAATNLPLPPAAVRPPPGEIAGFQLLDAPDQGERVLLTGVLDWGVVGVVNVPFSLTVQQADGDMRPVCHLIASASVANPLVGTTVSVAGTRWRVQGSDLPLVVVESLRENK